MTVKIQAPRLGKTKKKKSGQENWPPISGVQSLREDHSLFFNMATAWVFFSPVIQTDPHWCQWMCFKGNVKRITHIFTLLTFCHATHAFFVNLICCRNWRTRACGSESSPFYSIHFILKCFSLTQNKDILIKLEQSSLLYWNCITKCKAK